VSHSILELNSKKGALIIGFQQEADIKMTLLPLETASALLKLVADHACIQMIIFFKCINKKVKLNIGLNYTFQKIKDSMAA